MRGPVEMDGMPDGLIRALRKFDDLRVEAVCTGGYEAAEEIARKPSSGPELNRLADGMRKISFRGLCRFASAAGGHLCPVYIRQKMDVFRSLNGMFYWNDGHGEMRRLILLRAWRLGSGRVPRRPGPWSNGAVLWTPEETARLRCMWEFGVPVEAIGENLGRSPTRIRGKASANRFRRPVWLVKMVRNTASRRSPGQGVRV